MRLTRVAIDDDVRQLFRREEPGGPLKQGRRSKAKPMKREAKTELSTTEVTANHGVRQRSKVRRTIPTILEKGAYVQYSARKED